jgi:PST family polysaccharide transporter
MKKNVNSQIALGVFWTVLMRMVIRFLGIISVLILARLLLPEDYGLVAKAVLISGFLELITQFGFETALIRNKNATDDDYNTVWTVSIIRSAFLSVVLLICAIPSANFFNEPAVESLIYCYAFSTLLSGFTNVGIVDFRKEMTFDKDFKFNVYRKLSIFVTTITLAFLWRTYWAFPVGILVGTIFSVVISFVLSPYRPTLSLKSWHTLFNFAKWMFTYEFIGAFSTKLDTFLLSRYASGTELGLYTIAYELSGTPSTEIAMPVARAALPGLAKLRDEKDKFQASYTSILSLTLFVAVPASVGLSILSEHVTDVLLGSKWAAASPIVAILAFYGISRVVAACAVSALIAYDKVDLLVKLTVSSFLSRLVLLPIGVIYWGGALGISFGVLISGMFSIFSMLVVQTFLKMLSIKVLFLQTWRTIVSTVIMYFCLNSFIEFFTLTHFISIYWVLFIEVLTGFFLFTVSLLTLCLISTIENTPEEKIIYFIQERFKNGKYKAN